MLSVEGISGLQAGEEVNGLLRQPSQFVAQRYLVLLWAYGQGFCCQQ